MTALSLALAALTSGLAAPSPDDVSFARGIEARGNSIEAREHFRRAADGYNAEWREQPDPGVALMRGRAKYLAGDLGGAVAAFRAGLRLYPADAELRHGLAVCRADVPGATSPPREVRSRFTRWERFLFAAGSLLSACIGAWSRFTIRVRGTRVLIALGGCGLLASAWAEWQCRREAVVDAAITAHVVRDDAVLRTGNGASYPPRLPAPLPRGTEIVEVSRRGGWVQVETGTGEAGWLPDAALVPVQ